MKKLVHVLRNDAVGGVEHSTFALAQYLAEQGVEQKIIILSKLSSGISKSFENEKIQVFEISFSKAGFFKFIVIYYRCLKAFKPDVQLVSGAYGLHAILAMIAKVAGVKRCWTYLIMGPAERGLPRVVQYLMGQLARLFSEGEVSVSGYLKIVFNNAMGLPQRRIHVIHRWRNINGIAKVADAMRLKRNIPGPLFMTIGRLDWMKDFPGLINAFALFAAHEPEAMFYIAGEGHLRQQLEKQVAELGLTDKVYFLGHRTDIPGLLGGVDIFLFATSPTEGIGNVMIEAMAAGTPMICTDVGPCREVLGGGQAGILVPAADPQAMSDAMLALWRDPNRRSKLSADARDFAEHRYTRDVCGNQVLQLLFPT